MIPPAISREDLVLDLSRGCKPVKAFKIGVEHEKFIFDLSTLKRVPYKGGIEKILHGFQRFGWRPVLEEGQIIALEKGAAFVSLEPGGQLELSGAPFDTLHETAIELHQHLTELKEIISPLGFIAVGVGSDPFSKRDEIPWMPKARYRIMQDYMPEKGSHGLDMMTGTSTVQVNLDFSSEQDMVRKFRVGLALQPVVTALFANSSLSHGHANGFESFRRFIWQHTDLDRCGLLKFVFDASMGFERYVDYMLDVPMYFIRREGRYIPAAGYSFKDFMNGTLPILKGEFPTLEDWHDHLTVAFPETRLKKGYLEMRGADAGLEAHTNALPAFWTGLLYDPRSLDAACALIQEWSTEDLETVYNRVAKEGLFTSLKGRPLREIARVCLGLAREGLIRRRRKNAQGQDESLYLGYLEEIVTSGKTPAQKLVETFQKTKGSQEKVMDVLRF